MRRGTGPRSAARLLSPIPGPCCQASHLSMPSSLGVKGGGGIHCCVVQLLRLQVGWGSDGEMLPWGGPAGTQQGWSGVQTQSSDPSVVQDEPLGSHCPGRELVLVLSVFWPEPRGWPGGSRRARAVEEPGHPRFAPAGNTVPARAARLTSSPWLHPDHGGGGEGPSCHGIPNATLLLRHQKRGSLGNILKNEAVPCGTRPSEPGLGSPLACARLSSVQGSIT